MNWRIASDGNVRIEFDPPAGAVDLAVRLHEQDGFSAPRLATTLVPVSLHATGDPNRYAAKIVTPGGIRAAVTLVLEPAGGGVDASVIVDVTGANGRGLLQHELRATPVWMPEAAVYLPGIWVDGNPYTAAGAPSAREGSDWTFREDRMAWPAAIAWSREAGAACALLRCDPAGKETTYPFSRGLRHVGAIPLDTNACDQGSLGFATGGGRTALCARYPFAELPRSYQDKRKLVDPMAGFFRARTGTRWRVRYRLIAFGANDAYEAIEPAWRAGFGLWRRGKPYRGDRSVSRIKDALDRRARHFHFAPRGRRGVAGYYTFVETFSDKPVIGICEPGFTGKAFYHALHAIERASVTGDDRHASLAAGVFDSWIDRGMRAGLPFDFWCRELFGIPAGVPFTFDPPWVLPGCPSVATRRVAEAAIALTRAASATGNEKWSRTARGLLDTLLDLQLPSGGYARRYRMKDRAAMETDNVGATPSVIPALLEGHKVTGDARLRDAAVRAGEFVIENMVKPVRFHGSTLDANCEDKEAATAALESLRGLHETTGDPRFLDAAVKAAWMSLTWVCLTDVPFAERTMFRQWGLRTSGLTLVSTENNHADVYLFSTPGDLRWLGGKTGDGALSSIAWDTLLAALQLVPTSAHPAGPFSTGGGTVSIPEGLVPEVLNQTTWVYLNLPVLRKNRRWIKGYTDPKTSMWTIASVWDALDAMRGAVTGDEWAGYLEP